MIKQRAEALNEFDNPAGQTIGIVEGSAAGKDSWRYSNYSLATHFA